MTPTRQPDQRPGTLGWSMVLDLTTLDRSQLAAETVVLTDPRLAGRTVTVRTGSLHPYDLDRRVVHLLAEAILAGVSLDLEGDPVGVGAWYHAVGQARDQLRNPGHARAVSEQTDGRHLRVVR